MTAMSNVAFTIIKQQISATPPDANVAASVIWRRIQMFRLNSTHHHHHHVSDDKVDSCLRCRCCCWLLTLPLSTTPTSGCVDDERSTRTRWWRWRHVYIAAATATGVEWTGHVTARQSFDLNLAAAASSHSSRAYDPTFHLYIPTS